uniref:Uncharacterized protein n=1 Tax=Anguilla anguilla TaxID=7936 RepID=A0A0E9SNA2_ANGAN
MTPPLSYKLIIKKMKINSSRARNVKRL